MLQARKFKNLTKYQLSATYLQLIISTCVLLLNFIIALIVKHTTSNNEIISGNVDIMILVWALIFGIAFFGVTFKFALLNGVSRKTFFWGSMTAILTMTLIWTVLTVIFIFLSDRFVNMSILYKMIYEGGLRVETIQPIQNIAGMILWEFAMIFMFMMLGWLVRIIFYRASKLQRYLIGGGLILLIPLFILCNATTGGAFGRGFMHGLKAVMGLTLSTPSPFIGMAFALGLGLLFSGCVYLLLRRAEIKE